MGRERQRSRRNRYRHGGADAHDGVVAEAEEHHREHAGLEEVGGMDMRFEIGRWAAAGWTSRWVFTPSILQLL